MVQELYDLVARLPGVDMSYVARLGVAHPDVGHPGTEPEDRKAAVWDSDFFARYVSDFAEAQCLCELQLLQAVDSTITFLKTTPDLPPADTTSVGLAT